MTQQELTDKVHQTLKAIEAQAGMPHWGMGSVRMLSVDQAQTDLDIYYRKYYVTRFKAELEAEKHLMSPGEFKHAMKAAERVAALK